MTKYLSASIPALVGAVCALLLLVCTNTSLPGQFCGLIGLAGIIALVVVEALFIVQSDFKISIPSAIITVIAFIVLFFAMINCFRESGPPQAEGKGGETVEEGGRPPLTEEQKRALIRKIAALREQEQQTA